MMSGIDNKIYVCYQKPNKVILKFPKGNIETTAYIGKNGTTKEKKEGDEKTPIGEFELGIILGLYKEEELTCKLKSKYMQITKELYWVDDPNSQYYNQLVDISNVKKDWKTAEHLIDYPIQYEYLVEIKTNPKNIPGRGSAVFLHCIKDESTQGCVAIDRKEMKKLIEHIDKQTKILLFTDKNELQSNI